MVLAAQRQNGSEVPISSKQIYHNRAQLWSAKSHMGSNGDMIRMQRPSEAHRRPMGDDWRPDREDASEAERSWEVILAVAHLRPERSDHQPFPVRSGARRTLAAAAGDSPRRVPCQGARM